MTGSYVPTRIGIALDEAESKLVGSSPAGAAVVSVSAAYLGARRARRIAERVFADSAARLQVAQFRDERSADERAAAAAQLEERKRALAESDPVAAALAEWPADLVVEHCVTAINGAPVERGWLAGWVEDLHPDVERRIAVEVLHASGRIAETREERGEG